MRSCWVLGIAGWALAACSAKLEDAPGNITPTDGDLDTPPGTPDTPVDTPPDAALVDCTSGGDARAIDMSTNTCLTRHDTLATYAVARTTCAGISAHLVVIKSALTNAAVDALAGRAWMGAEDNVIENTFVWLEDPTDVVGANGGYTNWRMGEPNNVGDLMQPENCAQIEPTGTWDDRDCVQEYTFVCQRP